MNYYNDNDPKSVVWLRELIKQKAIPLGDVDGRSITDVTGSDLKGYTQCHFFAGIGGWAEALRLAGWPTTIPIWTGSCPCQPFSCAGQRKGEKDKRHLWPEFFRLIRECRPVTVFGEQVERAIGMGWLDGIFTDLEGEGYACGATVLGAYSVGAPHIRQRLYWLADAESPEPKRERAKQNREQIRFANSSEDGGMEHPAGDGRDARGAKSDRWSAPSGCGENFWSNSVWLPCADGKARRTESGICPLADGISGRMAMLRGFGNAIVPQVAAEFVKAFVGMQ